MSSLPSEFEKANRNIKLMEAEVRTEIDGDLSKMTTGGILAEFRYLLDLKERFEGIDKKINKSIAGIKEALIERSYEDDTMKFTSDELGVTVKESEKFKIIGDWEQIQRDLLEAGYGTSVQRRITEKHILEAFYAGDLRLPDGLDLYSFRTTLQRRK